MGSQKSDSAALSSALGVVFDDRCVLFDGAFVGWSVSSVRRMFSHTHTFVSVQFAHDTLLTERIIDKVGMNAGKGPPEPTPTASLILLPTSVSTCSFGVERVRHLWSKLQVTN